MNLKKLSNIPLSFDHLLMCPGRIAFFVIVGENVAKGPFAELGPVVAHKAQKVGFVAVNILDAFSNVFNAHQAAHVLDQISSLHKSPLSLFIRGVRSVLQIAKVAAFSTCIVRQLDKLQDFKRVVCGRENRAVKKYLSLCRYVQHQGCPE